MDLLDKHYSILSSSLRQSLVKSLILLRNRGHLKSAEVLPLFFRLFRCQDKNLRDLLFKHIVAGVLATVLHNPTPELCQCNSNQSGLNTAVSAMMYLCGTHSFIIQSALNLVKFGTYALLDVCMIVSCITCNVEAAWMLPYPVTLCTDQVVVSQTPVGPIRELEISNASDQPLLACRCHMKGDNQKQRLCFCIQRLHSHNIMLSPIPQPPPSAPQSWPLIALHPLSHVPPPSPHPHFPAPSSWPIAALHLDKDKLTSWLHADIKGANQKHRNEQLNRSIQNFLYGLLATDNDVAAKKSLAVLTELWRRHVWRDARTVNVIGESLQWPAVMQNL